MAIMRDKFNSVFVVALVVVATSSAVPQHHVLAAAAFVAREWVGL